MTRSGFRIAALVLFGVLLATNFYRAATQSLVHDEALTWAWYLSGPASTLFTFYSPNNHFLATVLFRISTALFGQSEFAIRLPAVLAGAWFYWTLFRLLGMILGEGWLFLLGCAALALNPLLLDFMVAARGYGLAMAGLFWALYQMLAWFNEGFNEQSKQRLSESQRSHLLWKAALGCAVAVAANLTFVMPVLVLGTAFCVLLVRQQAGSAPALPAPALVRSAKAKKAKHVKQEARPGPSRSYGPLLHFIVPLAAMAVAFLLAAPIDVARSEDFYAGTPTAIKSLRNLMDVSFAYGASAGSGFMQRTERIWSNAALLVLPLIALAALTLVSAKRNLLRSIAGLATFLSSLAVVGSFLLLVAAHLIFGVPYPQDRTGIYFIPLAFVGALGLAKISLEGLGVPRWIGYAVAIGLASCGIEFATQWNVRSFLVWRYDADAKSVFEALEDAPKPPGPIRLGASWALEPTLNYYRNVRNAAWMMPVERDGFNGVRQFYVVSMQDQPNAPWSQLRQIYRGPTSGVVVAVPKAAP